LPSASGAPPCFPWTGSASLLRGADAPAPARPRGPGTVEVWSHLVIANGVELTIGPAQAGLSPHQARAFFREVGAVFERIRTEDE